MSYAVSRKTVKGKQMMTVVEVESAGKLSRDRKPTVGGERLSWQKAKVAGSKRDWYCPPQFFGLSEEATTALLPEAEKFYAAYDEAMAAGKAAARKPVVEPLPGQVPAPKKAAKPSQEAAPKKASKRPAKVAAPGANFVAKSGAKKATVSN